MTPKQVKDALNKTVGLKGGGTYRFTGATIRKSVSGKIFYQAELQDLTARHSVRICKLEDIEPVESGQT